MKSLLYVLLAFQFLYSSDLVERTQIHMATFVKISLPQAQAKLFTPSFSIVKKMDETFSTYKKSAEAFKLNQSKKAKVSEDFLRLLSLSSDIYIQSKGYFSIAIGSITKDLYHFGEVKQYLPSKQKLNEAQSSALGFFVKESTVILDKGVSIDFGGIAKGYTVDKVRRYLEHQGVGTFQVSLSGDIYCKGKCSIAIQSPFSKEDIVEVLTLKDTAISTSGNYERYIKSKKNNHLINPKSRRSQQHIASMTLYSKTHSNAFLDAMATALSVMPQKNRMEILKNEDEISYLFITNDKKVYRSKDKNE